MPGWRAVLGVLAAIAAVLVFSAFGATSAGSKSYDAGAMASWVQAIGSIAAIFGAYYVGERQANAARVALVEAEARALRRKHDTYLAIVRSAIERVHLAERCLVGSRVNPVIFMLNIRPSFVDSIEAACVTLGAIPLHEIGDANAILALETIARAAGDLAAAISEHHLLVLKAREAGELEPSSDFFSMVIRQRIESASEAFVRFDQGLQRSRSESL